MDKVLEGGETVKIVEEEIIPTDPPATPPSEETADDIRRTMEELKKKLDEKSADEAGRSAELMEMQLADVVIRIDKNDVVMKGITPAEAMLLVAEHHVAAGGNPIKDVKLGKKLMRDPVVERNRLYGLYAAEKVNALYPGAIPTLPKSFSAALSRGVGSTLPAKRMMDFEVAGG